MPIYLIRHGQSAFNAAYNNDGIDPMTFDAPLTQKGFEQAKAARAAVVDLGIELVITTPLTRAIQTALCIFEGIAPIKIMANMREYLTHSCDVGRSPAQLQIDFPTLSFDHIDDLWWHQGPVNKVGVPVEPESVFKKRVIKLANDLQQIPQRPIAVVGHMNIFRELSGHRLLNCEIHRYLKYTPVTELT